MKVYILTVEPYHDNSRILGVFADEARAIESLKASVDPANINCDDRHLVEWDVATNKGLRVWKMEGKQIWENVPRPEEPG